MHGAHGKLALPLVKVVPKGGTEQIYLPNMVVPIVQEIILNTKLAMTMFPAQVFSYHKFSCKNKLKFHFL